MSEKKLTPEELEQAAGGRRLAQTSEQPQRPKSGQSSGVDPLEDPPFGR